MAYKKFWEYKISLLNDRFLKGSVLYKNYIEERERLNECMENDIKPVFESMDQIDFNSFKIHRKIGMPFEPVVLPAADAELEQYYNDIIVPMMIKKVKGFEQSSRLRVK
jgi:hypothetical protein